MFKKNNRSILIAFFLCFAILLPVGCSNPFSSAKSTDSSKSTTTITTTTEDSTGDSTTYSESEEKEQTSFSTFTDELFKEEVTYSTLNLHFTLKNPENYGITEYPLTLGDFSDNAIQEMSSQLEDSKIQLEAFDYDALTSQQQLTYDILDSYLETEVSGTDLYLYYEPLNDLNGIQAEIPIVLAEYTFHDEKDVTEYLTLLSQLKDYYKQIIDFEKEKSAAGLFMTSTAAKSTITQCEAFIANPESSYLISTFNDKINNLETLSQEKKDAYMASNKEAVINQVIPSYTLLIDGLKQLQDTGTNEKGLSYYDNGLDYYEYLIKSDVGSYHSVSEIKDMIEKQQTADATVIQELIKKDSSLLEKSESYEFALTDPKEILEDLKTKMSDYFPSLDNTNYTIKYVDESLEDYLSPAFYMTPTIDDTSENVIYINNASSYDKMELYTTLAHEGYPGHLYQTVYSNNTSSDNLIRTLNFSGYSEGYATYVEMGSYYWADIDSNLAALLQKNQSLTLSLYAAIDVGIHSSGWDKDQVADYLSDYGMDDDATVTEIYQQIVANPAYYLKYYLGYLEFLNLKAEAQEALGNDFSIKEYHQFILELGPAPFSIVEKYLQEWIENQ